MPDFTIPGDSTQDDYVVPFPVHLLVGNLTPAGGSFVIIGYPPGPCLALYSEPDYARQAIHDLNLSGATPLRITDPANLRTLLESARTTSRATHLAIDVSNRSDHGTGRIRSIQQVLDVLHGREQ